MTDSHIPLIVIAGPTGVGKTDLSIYLAQRFNGEVINGDSLQVYQGLDIGTGKITREEMDGVPHHLLDILPPDATYNASLFREQASEQVREIHKRGKLPIVVGGTGLYLEGLLCDLSFGKVEDPAKRAQLEAEAETIGAKALWERLADIDPEACAKIPYQNVRRTIRALEVIHASGELFSKQTEHQAKQSVFDELLVVLDRPRELLYDRINRRVVGMVEAGLEAEVHGLYQAAGAEEWQSLQGIGYKEWFPYFEDKQTLDQVIAQIQQHSRRYAKRQLTWFRNRMKAPHWLDMEAADAHTQAENWIAEHLEKGGIE